MPALGSYALARFMGVKPVCPSTILFVCSVYEGRESEYCLVLVTREFEGM